MKEDFLHYIWKTKRFRQDNLHTTDGENLQILQFGHHNHDAGPDFLNGKIKIGNTIWSGHIEIHINTSDWNNHKHQNDPAYNNVILHVVQNHDKHIQNLNGQKIPTLELAGLYDQNLCTNYSNLLNSNTWIPCNELISQADLSKLPFFLERKLTDRLIRKHYDMSAMLDKNKNDWEEVLYANILRYMGHRSNNEAFENLAIRCPHKLLIKQGENLQQKESLLFGQAGLLQHEDDYFSSLATTYKHLQHKYDLYPMNSVEWKFSRMRPASFPTLRIAQVAALYHKTPQLFQNLIKNPDYASLCKTMDVQPSPYWLTPYRSGKTSKSKSKAIGSMTKDIILINAYAPLIFTYGQVTGNQDLKDKAIDILAAVPPENNIIVRKWRSLGIKPDNAAQSQALLELKNNMCNKSRCLDCFIGQQIIQV